VSSGEQAAGEFEFDAETRLTGDGPEFETALPADWGGIPGVNGGFMLALCTRAMARVLPFPDPVVASGFYLRPGSAGPARVTTEVIRAGKTTAFGQAALWRDGKEVLRATAAFTDLAQAAERTPARSFAAGAPPELPPPEECYGFEPGAARGVPIASHFDYRMAAAPGWLRRQPSGDPRYEFWMRFRDGREPDLVSLPLFVDAAPPAVLELGVMSTTVELTVYLRARPAPGWLACRTWTKYVGGGYHEEDFEIWDSAGTLVAQSRQLALVLG
jgi:acyl-CoA thioesterase